MQMALFNPKQMYIRFDESPHFVWVAFDEEVHRPRLAGVFFHFEQKRLGVHNSSECISKRAQVELAICIHEVQNLRPAMQVIGSADSRGIRRQEFCEGRDKDKEAEDRRANQSQSVLPE